MVASEVEHEGVGPCTYDVEHQLGIGAVKAVDRLIGVAHAKEIGIIARHVSQHHELQWVHVLCFIDEKRLRAMAERREHSGIVAQQRNRFTQEKIEVKHTATVTKSDVAIEHVGKLCWRKWGVTLELSSAFCVECSVESLTEGPANFLI